MKDNLCCNCWYFDNGTCTNPYLFARQNTIVDGNRVMTCFKSQYDILASAGKSEGQTKLL